MITALPYFLVFVDLTLFDGEGGEAGGEQTAAAEPAQETAQEPENKPDRKAQEKAYRDYVNGEAKEFHQAEIQRILNRRFADHAALEQTVNDQKPLIEKLSARYGTSDIAKIVSAIDADTEFWEREADNAGTTVEQLQHQRQIEAQNEALLKAEQDRLGRERAERQYAQWMQEAEGVRAKYPGFDLAAEAQNPQFVSMLRSNVPMETAYKALHADDLAQSAAQQAEQRVVDNIRAKGTRPVENGTAQKSAFTVGTDVAKLTKAQRQEYAERAARGERVTFAR